MKKKQNQLLFLLLPVGCLLLLLSGCGNESAENPGKNADNNRPFEPVKTDIFIGGQGGYHTYRIPALVLSTRQTLLAFCEGRKNNALDHGDIDMMLRRSFDLGKTWEPMQLVWEDGDNTVGNPSPVVDRITGTIWLLFCLNNNHVFVTRSEDEGATWSIPENITENVKLPYWGWYATGPGHGIQLAGGRLLIPCDHRILFARYSHVLYSDDHGETWKLGGSTNPRMDECMAVERADGSIYLTMRNNQYRNTRAFALSTNGGESWSSVQPEPTLVDPVCQASIARFTNRAPQGEYPLLFLNPASEKRENMTFRISYDGGETWPVGKRLQEGPAAYSDMAVLPDTTVTALYENGVNRLYEKITFARLGMEWIESE